MPLALGAQAPDFELPELDGGVVRLSEWLAAGPVVVVFFKTTCPTCMLAFPFLDRLQQRTSRLRVLAVSQDGVEATRRFHDDFEITLPTVLDAAAEGYAVSNAFGITHVPSMFLVARARGDGTHGDGAGGDRAGGDGARGDGARGDGARGNGVGVVEWFSTGFSKPELEELGERARVEVFGVQDRVPVWKPG